MSKLEARPSEIRLLKLTTQLLERQMYDASPVGDTTVVIGLTSDDELFVDINYVTANKEMGTTRIIFDHATTSKIRTLFRRQTQ